MQHTVGSYVIGEDEPVALLYRHVPAFGNRASGFRASVGQPGTVDEGSVVLRDVDAGAVSKHGLYFWEDADFDKLIEYLKECKGLLS